MTTSSTSAHPLQQAQTGQAQTGGNVKVRGADLDTPLAARLRLHQQRTGQSMAAVAARIGTSRQVLDMWRRGGITTPAPDVLARLAAALSDPDAPSGTVSAAELAEELTVPAFGRQAELFRRTRAHLQRTPAELAALVGVTGHTWRMWEAGALLPDERHIARLAAVLAAPDLNFRRPEHTQPVEGEERPSAAEAGTPARRDAAASRGRLPKQRGKDAARTAQAEDGTDGPVAVPVDELASLMRSGGGFGF